MERIYHPDIDRWASQPAVSIPIWESRGWVREADAPPEAVEARLAAEAAERDYEPPPTEKPSRSDRKSAWVAWVARTTDTDPDVVDKVSKAELIEQYG